MSVGIFKNGKYNKVAGNAKDSTAANTTYNNGTSGLQANNVQSAIDEVSAKIGQENISQVGNSVTGAINNLNSNLIPKSNIAITTCTVVATGSNSSFAIPNEWKPSECIVLEARVYNPSGNRYYTITDSVWFDADLNGGGRLKGDTNFKGMTCTIKFLKI